METIAGGIPDDIHADDLACHDGDRFVESMRYVRRYPEELPALADLPPQIATPVTIINGRPGVSSAGLSNAWLYRARPIALTASTSSRPLRTNAGIPVIASSSRWMLGRTSWAVAFRGLRESLPVPLTAVTPTFSC